MKQELMICPKRKECIYNCACKKPHKKDFGCISLSCSCPKCVPYRPKPSSMFAGLRKGDRVELETISSGTFLEYYHHYDKRVKVYYTTRYKSENEAPTERPTTLLKSIKKLAVKK